MSKPRIVFVMSAYQNAFFGEIASAFVTALRTVGVTAIVVDDPGAHEVGDDDVFVLLPPHEYVTLEGSGFVDDPEVAARTIGISAEQPHQVFFERNAAVAARLGAVLDFSPLAVAAYQRLGIAARHQRFGYIEEWDRFHGGPRPPAELTTEVLYLGNKRPRRLAALARAADELVEHHGVLRISDNAETNRGSSPTFVAGEAKRVLLRTTKLLVNIHQGDEKYFEWLRFADAAHSGVPVLSERSQATEPFVDGVDFLSFEPGDLGRRLDAVLTDAPRLEEVAAAAYRTLRATPLPSLLESLLDAASALMVAAAPPRRLPAATRTTPLGRERVDPPAKTTWHRPRRSALARRVGFGAREALVAPEGVTFRQQLELPPGVLIATCVCDGVDVSGSRSLEGVWPWEPWRLLHDQHLGRVMRVDTDVLAASRRWITEAWVADHPHLAVQLFAAFHGIGGAHVPRPIATLHHEPVDPEHRVPAEVASRCRQILEP